MTGIRVAKPQTGKIVILALRKHMRQTQQGFTLIELCVVIFFMGVIAAIAFPSILPMIAFSRLEGDARHLSNFGRAIIAEAALQHSEITVRFDFEDQQYYAVRWVYPDEGTGEGEGEEADQMEIFGKMRAGGDMSPEDMISMLDNQRFGGGGGDLFGEDEGFDDELANKQLGDRFDRFAKNLLMAQAKNVKHDDFLGEIDIFEEEDEFELEADNEPVEEELKDPVLARTAMSDDVFIDSVIVDGQSYSSGVAEAPITSLGLSGRVAIYIRDIDDNYYTIMWDPLTGNSNVLEGREDVL